MTYTVQAERSGKWWSLTVPEVRGAFSQCRRLDQVQARARVLLEDMEIPGASEALFEVDVKWPDPVAAKVGRLRELDEAAAEAERSRREERVNLARSLKEEGWPLRDIAALLGVSFQRVSALLR